MQTFLGLNENFENIGSPNYFRQIVEFSELKTAANVLFGFSAIALFSEKKEHSSKKQSYNVNICMIGNCLTKKQRE